MLELVNRTSFQFYIAQDAHFLEAFSAAYTVAAKAAAAFPDKKVAITLHDLQKGVAKELQMHASYAKVTSIPQG
jgi:thiaminase